MIGPRLFYDLTFIDQTNGQNKFNSVTSLATHSIKICTLVT